MNTRALRIGRWLLAALLWTAWPGATGQAEESEPARPSITRIDVDGVDIVVTIDVPAGVRKVMLESRTRLGVGAWVPRAVERTDGTRRVLTFRLKRSQQMEVLRVRGDTSEALPTAFYGGENTFNGQTSSTPGSAWDMYRVGAEGVPDATGGGAPTANREVVESDIWKLSGNTLYFFNAYRGLQVIDLTDPDAPVLRGTLEIPASGEEMYLLGERHALLLARNGCGWSSDSRSRVLVVDVGVPQPAILSEVAVEGDVSESRLVGSALYLTSQVYRKVTVPRDDPTPPDDPTKPGSERGASPAGITPVEVWEWGTVITSIDLAEPASPVKRGTQWVPGYGNVIYATDRLLFVASRNTTNWWLSNIQVIDITAPDGTLKPLGVIQAAGAVADKFKMQLAGDVFTVISEVSNWSSPDGAARRMSVLETWSLAQPGTPERLGRLEVGHGEGLYATRFDGDRVYIVTFLRIDPLWVVDLKDPRNPKVSGELEIPGWSTYIQPLGDRLVAVGIDNVNSWRVAVSLFDVADPAKPGLLAKVPLGENHSWSEVNQNEKALTVLTDAGLILVPYQGWSEQGYASRIQLIDLKPDTLVARGVIEHRLQPRRATLIDDRIVSVSGRELIVVDATDRDAPKVTAQEELSWGVDRVLVAGDHLYELSNGDSSNGTGSPWLRVTEAANPDNVLHRAILPFPHPMVGATIREGFLYVLQAATPVYTPPVPEGEQPPAEPPKPNVFLSVYDLANAPAVALAGKVEVATTDLGWYSQMKAVWPKPGLLVWASNGGGRVGWYYMLDGPWAMDAAIGGRFWWPWWGGGAGRLVSFRVSDPTQPALASDRDLGKDQNWWGFSEAFTSDGLVYLSHQSSQFVATGEVPREPGKEILPPGYYVTKHYLDVVDYADPALPTVRKPVDLPGQLRGISHGGSLLYTVGPRFSADGQTDWTDHLDALAYDGLEAARVASMKQSSAWPRDLAVEGPNILIGQPPTDTTPARVEAWTLELIGAGAGNFVKRSGVELATPAQDLHTFGSLVVAQTSGSVVLIDAADPARLRVVNDGEALGCIWPNLSQGDGAAGRGVWLPLQDHGVLAIPVMNP